MTPRTLAFVLLLLASSASAAWAETAVPAAAPPTVDGRVDDAEWEGALRQPLSPKGDVFLKHHEGDLYVGIRGTGPSIAGLALLAKDKVLILHSSASIGSAEYVKQGETWRNVHDFDWQCRESGGRGASEDARQKHLEGAGWCGSTINMGRKGETEFRIGAALLGKEHPRLAVVSLDLMGSRSSDGGLGFWPETVDDGARDDSLLMGKSPDILELRPERWATLDLVQASLTAVLQPGTVQEFACDADETQRYTCYLPTAYDVDKTWPILYCFSSEARGDWYTEHLRGICEKRGWIVVGSLTWRSTAKEDETDAVAALLEDAQARFHLEPKRQYACGFAEGGRLSFELAERHPERITGVIAIGMRWDSKSLARKGLAVGLVCGKKDPFYGGVKRLHKALTKARNPVRTFPHRGAHEMPDDAVLAKAVKWLDDLARDG